MMAQKTSHKTVPAKFYELTSHLSQERIIKLLIYAIHQYKLHKISLEAIISLAEMIQKSHSFGLSDNIMKILDEIKSLSVVDTVLTDILEELQQADDE